VYFQSTREGNTGLVAIDPTDDYLDIYVADVVDGVPGVARNVGEPVNSSSPDGEHALSPDGTRLYITSNRPGSVGGTDIWVAEKTGDAWGEPVALPAPINTDANELQPAFAADDPDTMYFVSDRTGEATIYRSTFADGAWSEPEVVVTGYVGEPSLVADGSVLYFVQVLIDDKGIYGSNIWYTERTA
jgi:Tol biopolymer transport system component